MSRHISPGAMQLTPLDADGNPTAPGRWYVVSGVELTPAVPDPAEVFIRACEERGRFMWGEAARRFLL